MFGIFVFLPYGYDVVILFRFLVSCDGILCSPQSVAQGSVCCDQRVVEPNWPAGTRGRHTRTLPLALRSPTLALLLCLTHTMMVDLDTLLICMSLGDLLFVLGLVLLVVHSKMYRYYSSMPIFCPPQKRVL